MAQNRPTRQPGRRPRRLGAFAVAITVLLAVGWIVAPSATWETPADGPGSRVVKAGLKPSASPTPAPAQRPSSTPAPSPSPSETTPAPVVPPTGPGTFAVAAGQSAQAGRGAVTRYTVEVETGLPFDRDAVAVVVDTTLADPRSWTGSGDHAFQRVPANGDVRILVASPETTDELCVPLRTGGEVSCRNGALVVVNAERWAFGVPHYGGDLDAYRRYVVNHEMGHGLGFSHVACPGPGALAPVMLQQTYGLDGCAPNPWPYP